MSRKVAREMGMQLLFQLGFDHLEIGEQVDNFINGIFREKVHNGKPLKKLDERDVQYIKEVVTGTMSNLVPIDKKIEELAQEWSLNRIAKVDLAILRLAVFEILFMDDIPKEVSINEAVELAKKYSTEDSRSFVNGILGKVVE